MKDYTNRDWLEFLGECERLCWSQTPQENAAADEKGRALFAEHGAGWYRVVSEEPLDGYLGCLLWCNRWDEVARLWLFVNDGRGDAVEFVSGDYFAVRGAAFPDEPDDERRAARMAATRRI